MRTTLTLDDDVYQHLLSVSNATGERLGKVASELLRRGIERSKYKQSKSAFPIFTVNEDGSEIPGFRASELIDDEE